MHIDEFYESNNPKCEGIIFQPKFLLCLLKKSVLYAKITVSQEILFQISVLNILQVYIFAVTILSQILIIG